MSNVDYIRLSFYCLSLVSGDHLSVLGALSYKGEYAPLTVLSLILVGGVLAFSMEMAGWSFNF